MSALTPSQAQSGPNSCAKSANRLVCDRSFGMQKDRSRPVLSSPSKLPMGKGPGPGPRTGLKFLQSRSGPTDLGPGLFTGPGPVQGPDPATLASRQIEFDHPTKVSCRLSLRLTLTSIASPPGTPLPQYHTYLLSAELIEKELSELPQPRQLLPINPAPSRSPRPRANSLPLNVLGTSTSLDSPQSRGYEQTTSASLDVPGAGEGGSDHTDNRPDPPERNFFVRSWKTILDLFD